MTYWFNEYAIHHRVNWERHQAQVEKHIYPYIGDLPLSLCETRHWLECFDRAKRETPYAAGYVFQMCKQALKFCRVRRYAISNALDDLTIQDVGKKQEKGDRVHDMGELTQIWLSTTGKMYKPYYASLLRLLVVFGCRSQEVRLSTWKEWDLKDWIWIVPKEHSKGGEKIIRPIPKLFGPFVEDLCKEHSHSGLLLGEVKKPEAVSQWGRGIYKGWAKRNHGRYTIYAEPLPPLNDMGIAPHVVEQLLGHVLGGVMAIYNRSQYLPEKLDALNKWMERLELISGEHSNVTILKVAK
jgi:integrase